MQEIDAERRIRILRGEGSCSPPPPALPPRSQIGISSSLGSGGRPADNAAQPRKRRRLAGEDDTDRDIRVAQERAIDARNARDRLALVPRHGGKDTETPLLDKTGHINLFPSEIDDRRVERNAEAEAEAADKKKRYEDQYTMRFANAAGFKEDIGRRPWYSSSGQDVTAPGSMPEKDVWGNEDPRRKEREQARLSSNDPLAAMKRGVQQLKATEQERKRWNEEKRAELKALDAEERHRSRHRRRDRARSEESLEGFSLDKTAVNRSASGRESRSGKHHEVRHRHGSRDRSHRRRHRSSSRSHHTGRTRRDHRHSQRTES